MTEASKYWLLICIAFTFASCQKNEVGDELTNIEMRCSPKLTPDVLNALDFTFSGGKFECENVTLECQVHRSENTIFISFGKSYIPHGQGCYGSSSRDIYDARGSFVLEDLKNGDYMMVISNFDNMLYAALRIDEKKIAVQNQTGATISFGREPFVVFKIPKDAIWGYAHSYPDSLAHAFQDSLLARGAVPYGPLLENGSYGSFYIQNSDISNVYTSESDVFLLKTSLDTSAIHSVMKHFCDNQHIDWIQVYTGKGDNLMQY